MRFYSFLAFAAMFQASVCIPVGEEAANLADKASGGNTGVAIGAATAGLVGAGLKQVSAHNSDRANTNLDKANAYLAEARETAGKLDRNGEKEVLRNAANIRKQGEAASARLTDKYPFDPITSGLVAPQTTKVRADAANLRDSAESKLLGDPNDLESGNGSGPNCNRKRELGRLGRRNPLCYPPVKTSAAAQAANKKAQNKQVTSPQGNAAAAFRQKQQKEAANKKKFDARRKSEVKAKDAKNSRAGGASPLISPLNTNKNKVKKGRF
ncbi:hypothetical protein PspLS_05391 [Pyricularia sp. CBS 133598]|nr:hypothetical protein PspLS_05391 [Pyricularia sp. CBS 133598]